MVAKQTNGRQKGPGDGIVIPIPSLVLSSLLVDIGRGVVLGLVDLVTEGVLGSSGTGAHAGVVVLGDLLVGLLGSTGSGTCMSESWLVFMS